MVESVDPFGPRVELPGLRVDLFGPQVDLLPPTCRDTTVHGGESHANVDPENARATDLDERVAHHDAHQSLCFIRQEMRRILINE